MISAALPRDNRRDGRPEPGHHAEGAVWPFVVEWIIYRSLAKCKLPCDGTAVALIISGLSRTWSHLEVFMKRRVIIVSLLGLFMASLIGCRAGVDVDDIGSTRCAVPRLARLEHVQRQANAIQ